MARKQQYDIYVADPNGWDDGCPDSEGVFFGRLPEGAQYVHMADGGHRNAGHVMITGHRAAVNFLHYLQASGDWVAPPEINPDGEKSRPLYGIRKHSC